MSPSFDMHSYVQSLTYIPLSLCLLSRRFQQQGGAQHVESLSRSGGGDMGNAANRKTFQQVKDEKLGFDESKVCVRGQ